MAQGVHDEVGMSRRQRFPTYPCSNLLCTLRMTREGKPGYPHDACEVYGPLRQPEYTAARALAQYHTSGGTPAQLDALARHIVATGDCVMHAAALLAAQGKGGVLSCWCAECHPQARTKARRYPQAEVFLGGVADGVVAG